MPFYQSLGPDAVKHIFNETNPSTIFGHHADLARLFKEGALEDLGIKKLLVCGGISEELRAVAGDTELIDYAAEVGSKEIEDMELNVPKPDPEKIVTLSYTSGTTGPPKGAMIANRNVVALTAAIDQLSLKNIENETVLLYLPLAHIMGRGSLYYYYGRGTGVGIFGGDYTKLMEDLQILKPTSFLAVPRILMRLYDGIQSKVQQGSWLKRKLFDKAVNSKVNNLRTKGEFKSTIYDKIIFSKI